MPGKRAVTSLSFALTLAALCTVAIAQTIGGKATIPETSPGRLLKSWLDSFNSGDVERHTEFLAQHGPQSDQQGAADRAQQDMHLREMVGGGFNFYEIEESSGTELRAILKERGGIGWAEIELKVDPAKPERIASISLHPASPPPQASPVREDQAALVKDVAAFLEKLTAEDRFSGVVLMAKDGKPFFEEAYGYADREKKIPNNIDTKFRVGSMNKMFTSVAIAQLVQQKKMNYTDTVAKLLPDYPDQEIAAKITVHQLLTHTSGLGDFFGPEYFEKKDNIRNLKNYVPFFGTKPLKFEPGKGWSYSNAGMIVAGLIVEKVSGQDYFDYVRDNIYKPAGMKDSDSYEKTKPQRNQSIGYTKQDGKWLSNYDTLPLRGNSAGGGDSTAPDLLRFDQALRSYKLLNADLTRTTTTGKVDTPLGDKYAYGFSDALVDGKRVVGHNGGAPGMNANLDMYWDSGYTVIVLANLDPRIAEEVNQYIRDRIRQ